MKEEVIAILKSLTNENRIISRKSINDTIIRIESIKTDANIYKYVYYAINFRKDYKRVFKDFLKKYEDNHDKYITESDLNNLHINESISSIDISCYANSYNINHGMILFHHIGEDRLIIKATINKSSKYDNRWIIEDEYIKYHLQDPPKNGSYLSHKVNGALVYSFSEGIDLPVYLFSRFDKGDNYFFKGIFTPVYYDGEGYFSLRRTDKISERDMALTDKGIKKMLDSSVDLYSIGVGKRRLGQGVFRKLLLRENDECAICGIKGKDFLFASHIKPYSECLKGEHIDINNGLLLCANHDFLFDRKYITISAEDGKVIVSKKLKESNYIYECHENVNRYTINKKMKKYIYHHNQSFENKNK